MREVLIFSCVHGVDLHESGNVTIADERLYFQETYRDKKRRNLAPSGRHNVKSYPEVGLTVLRDFDANLTRL